MKGDGISGVAGDRNFAPTRTKPETSSPIRALPSARMLVMKSFRRRISAFAVAIMIVPLFPVTASAIGTFDDDDGVPGEVHIERLAELGAIEGCDPPAN